MTFSLREQADLSVLLNEKHRKYHNLQHIHTCLAELEEFRASGHKDAWDPHWEIKDIVTQAIWYHDIVYNPYAKDNEEQSCDLYLATHQDDKYDSQVAKAIRATARHTVTQENLSHPTKIMLDIDLAGFGKPLHVFARNGIDIRHEYYNTLTMDFLVGRYSFYKVLAQRPTLYYTDYFKSKYHDKAVENMKWEMMLLDVSIKNDRPELWANEIEKALSW